MRREGGFALFSLFFIFFPPTPFRTKHVASLRGASCMSSAVSWDGTCTAREEKEEEKKKSVALIEQNFIHCVAVSSRFRNKVRCFGTHRSATPTEMRCKYPTLPCLGAITTPTLLPHPPRLWPPACQVTTTSTPTNFLPLTCSEKLDPQPSTQPSKWSSPF